MLSKIKKHVRATLGLCALLSTTSQAGFLSLPEITELPDLKRESLLRDLDVPSVRERDPDPASGPHLNVQHFKVLGIVEFPELGITKNEIDKTIERIRFNLMGEFKLLNSGYTEQEVNDVIDMLVDIEKSTQDRHVTDIDLQRLIFLIQEQRQKRGITLGAIETVADEIGQLYREKGFILANTFIPKQEIRDGIVTLSLLLGTLGQVKIEGNHMYNTAIIASVFDDDLTRPVTNDVIEENIYLINDYPGLSVQGLFKPGRQVGDTTLKLKVTDEQRYLANVRIDNHGSDETGNQRLYGEVFFNNVLGQADALQLGALSAFSPSNTTFYQLRYALNTFSPRWRLALGRTRNQFTLAQNDSDFLPDLSGETLQTDATLTYKIKRSRKQNYSVALKWENIFSDLQFGPNNSNGFLDDDVTNLSYSFNFDVLQEQSKILHQGSFSFTSGTLNQGLFVETPNYNIYNLDYTLLTFATLPFTDISTRILINSSFQFSDESLSSISQFALGGPTRARGYPVNQFSADKGALIGVDWVFDVPNGLDFTIVNKTRLKGLVQPFLFFDAAYGLRRATLGSNEDTTATLYDVGFGFRFLETHNIQGNIQFAFPVSNTLSDADLEEPEDGVRLVFDFQYSFR